VYYGCFEEARLLGSIKGHLPAQSDSGHLMALLRALYISNEITRVTPKSREPIPLVL
jgi:hypothetical protein